MTLEDCLEKFKKIKLDYEQAGALIHIKTSTLAGMLQFGTWGFLDTDYFIAYVPTIPYFKKDFPSPYMDVQLDTYDSMLKILEEEGFTFRYITDIKEI